MVEINLENMKDVITEKLGGNRILLKLIDKNGTPIEVITTIQNGEAIHDALEKVCVAPEYWYEEMQKELDEANSRIEEFEEILHNIGYQEAG